MLSRSMRDRCSSGYGSDGSDRVANFWEKARYLSPSCSVHIRLFSSCGVCRADIMITCFAMASEVKYPAAYING